MVHRELGPKAASGAVRPLPTHLVSEFDTIANKGHRFGPADAPVTIVEFADFECPVCRGFELHTLRPVQAAYKDKVAIVYRQWPLPYHRFALPAARAAECAGAQGRFEQIHDLMFAKQDSLGLKSFAEFAVESGVADTAAFNRCAASTSPMPSVDADIAAARGLKLFGTPSIIVNGYVIGTVPDKDGLDSLIRVSLARAGARQ